MKYITMLLFSTALFGGVIWNYEALAEKGWKVEIICKNGYLVQQFSPPTKGMLEETYCYDKSNWSGNCVHPPIKCTKEDK